MKEFIRNLIRNLGAMFLRQREEQVEVTDMISEAPIEHKQLYAQLKQEVLTASETT